MGERSSKDLIKVASWNIAKRRKSCYDLHAVGVDVALLNDAGEQPADVRDQI